MRALVRLTLPLPTASLAPPTRARLVLPNALASTSAHPSSSSRRPLSTTRPRHLDLGARYRSRAPPPPHPVSPALPAAGAARATPAAPAVRDKPVTIEGVKLPPRPIPPGDEDCCMSGCVHCVLTIYADDLEEYDTALKGVHAALQAKGVPRSEWPAAAREGSGGEGKDGENAKLVPVMDPTTAAFLALEKKLKHKY